MTADDPLRELRAALGELAAADAAELLEQARTDARQRVRTLLADALSEAMIEQLYAGSAPARAATPPQRPARAATPPQRPARAATPEPALDPQPPTGEMAWYVYGVVGADEVPTQPLPPGVEPSHPPRAVGDAGLAAIVSEVAVEDFGEAELRAHLSDMAWVERIARGHEDVLDQLRGQATVIPMRMCTVYRTQEGVREMLDREAEDLQAALLHLKGRTEWGVKVFAAPAITRSQDVATAASGTAYMEQRRHARDEAEQAAAEIEEIAAKVHEELCAIAADGLVVPSQRQEATGHRAEMILNGVYLVDDDTESTFHERVQSLQSEFATAGLELEITGPWPAYNFVPGAIGAGW